MFLNFFPEIALGDGSKNLRIRVKDVKEATLELDMAIHNYDASIKIFV